MRSFRLFIALGALVCATSQVSAQSIPVAAFNSVELRNGGKLVLLHGANHQVTLRKGSQHYTGFTVANGKLTIDKCRQTCPRGYEMEVEIITPQIQGVAVSDGGVVETRGSFPQQQDLAVAINHGGVIDTRSITANKVLAAINHGGVILTMARSILTASISNGGVVTFWGNAIVNQAVSRGGVVTKGAAGDVDKPLTEFSSVQRTLPPLPPVPPVPQTN